MRVYNNCQLKLKVNCKGTPLYTYIASKLKQAWSLEQISGRLKLENNGIYCSHETIYSSLYLPQG